MNTSEFRHIRGCACDKCQPKNVIPVVVRGNEFETEQWRFVLYAVGFINHVWSVEYTMYHKVHPSQFTDNKTTLEQWNRWVLENTK